MNSSIIPVNTNLALAVSILISLFLVGCVSQPEKKNTPAPVIDPIETTKPAVINKPAITPPIQQPSINKPVEATQPTPTLTPEFAPIIPNNTPETATIANEDPAQIKQRQMAIRKVVIILPDHPSLGEVNKDIESGIRKAHATNPINQQLQLIVIHDTLPPEQLMLKAKAYEPDWMIGPLTKNDIQGMKALLSQQQILLNKSNEPLIAYQFGMPIDDEYQQFFQRMKHANLPLLIISSNDNQEQRMIGNLQVQAQARGIPTLLLPNTTNGVTEWLRQDGGITQSKERILQLNKTLHATLESEPRVRQDIQALISLSNSKQTKSVMPSLRFHQIPWPVLASSRLIPSRKQTPFNEPDLDGVEVLTANYLTNDSNIQNAFEGFGWDSYQLLGRHQVQNFTGMSGQITSDNNRQYQRTLAWKPIIKGQIKDWPNTTPVTITPSEQ